MVMRIHHLNCISTCALGAALMDGRGEGLRGRLACHCLLIEVGSQLVLVDTGFGLGDVARPHTRLAWPFRLLLRPQLRAEMTAARQIERLGLRRRDVRHIVVTHLDFDHAGGVLAGSWPEAVELAHPQTRVSVPEEAVALTLTPDTEQDSPASHRLVTLLRDAGLLDTFADGDEVAPGVRMRGAPGHRSGHSLVELGDEFMFLADTLHHAVHVQHPDWDTMFEDDVELSQRTRRGTIERVCDGPVLGASHIDGFGRITGGTAPAWQVL